MTTNALTQIAGRRDWRQQLVDDYEPVANRLQSAYTRILPSLRSAAGDFASRLDQLYDANGELSVDRVRSLNQYQDLLARVDSEMRDFAVIVRNEMGGLVDSAILTGSDAALDMALSSAGRLGNALGNVWIRPDPMALRRLIDYVDSEPMRDNFARFGSSAAQNLADIILSGVAQGKGPEAIARLMRNFEGVPFAWADNTARTAQLWSYRQASHVNYAANGKLLEGWIWLSARDTRTCVSCWSQHGSLHGVDEILADHHRGRCSPAPAVKGADWWQNYPTGPEVFDTLSPAQQRQIMGPGMFDAWKAGKVDWKDFSQPYYDPVYGEMLRAASLKSLLSPSGRPFGRVMTLNGEMQADRGRPGTTMAQLSKFLNESEGPLFKALMDFDMHLVDRNWSTGEWSVNRDGVTAAAKRFVVESQNIQYGRDYILALAREQAAANGVNISLADAERLYNQHYGTQAQAILAAAQAGGVKLTEAQARRLATAVDGNYLSMVYSTESSQAGSLANAAARRRISLSGAELDQARENFRTYVQGYEDTPRQG